MKIPQIANKKPLLLVGALFMTNLSWAQLDLKLDADTPSVQNMAAPVLDAVLYSIDDEVMSVTTEFPILCTHILGYNPISDIQLRVYDPNEIIYNLSELRDFNLGIGQNVSYDLAGGSVNIVSENRNKAKCITSTVHDLIFDHGFEEIDTDADVVEMVNGVGILRYEDLPDSVNGNVNSINYTVSYTNTGTAQQTLDYIDYWPSADTNNIHFTFNTSDPWYACNESEPGINCGNYDIQRISEIRSVTVDPGATIRLEYDKFLIVPQNIQDGYVDMMAGFFLKTESAEGIDGVSKAATGYVYLNHIAVEKRIKIDIN